MPVMKLLTVQDGDTCTLEWQPPHQIISRIRLADIDAPERGEPFFKESQEYLRWLLAGEDLEIEPKLEQGWLLDANNRIVAYLWTDAALVNLAMVAHGFARAWACKPVGQYFEAIQRAELLAREEKIGIWSGTSQRVFTDRVRSSHPR